MARRLCSTPRAPFLACPLLGATQGESPVAVVGDTVFKAVLAAHLPCANGDARVGAVPRCRSMRHGGKGQNLRPRWHSRAQELWSLFLRLEHGQGGDTITGGGDASHLHRHRWPFVHPTDQLLGRCDWRSPGECSHHSSGKRSHHSNCSRGPGASILHSQTPVVLDNELLWEEAQVEVTEKEGLLLSISLLNSATITEKRCLFGPTETAATLNP